MELAGGGWLHPAVAKIFFDNLAAQGPDTSCEHEGLNGYGWYPFFPGALPKVDDMALLDLCAQKELALCGETWETKETYLAPCFYGFYRYNTMIRQALMKCQEMATCEDSATCGAKVRANWPATPEPWFGVMP